MSIKLGTNFEYLGSDFLDSRQGRAKTLENLKNWSIPVPEGFEVFVEETGFWYIWSSSTSDSITGHFSVRDSDLVSKLNELTTDLEELSSELTNKLEVEKEALIQGYEDLATLTLDPLVSSALITKVDKEEGKDLISSDLIKKLSTIEAGAEVNPTTAVSPYPLRINLEGTSYVYDGSEDVLVQFTPTNLVDSVNNQTGDIILTSAHFAGSLSSTELGVTVGTQEQFENKVDKVEGMYLSDRDFTTELSNKLKSIEDFAQVNPESLPNPEKIIIDLGYGETYEYDGSSEVSLSFTSNTDIDKFQVATLSSIPTENTLTYTSGETGSTLNFYEGQFATVANNTTITMYQVIELDFIQKKAVWIEISTALLSGKTPVLKLNSNIPDSESYFNDLRISIETVSSLSSVATVSTEIIWNNDVPVVLNVIPGLSKYNIRVDSPYFSTTEEIIEIDVNSIIGDEVVLELVGEKVTVNLQSLYNNIPPSTLITFEEINSNGEIVNTQLLHGTSVSTIISGGGNLWRIYSGYIPGYWRSLDVTEFYTTGNLDKIINIFYSESIWTGTADSEGLKLLGWDEEDIQMYQEYGVNWNEEHNEFNKVPKDNIEFVNYLKSTNRLTFSSSDGGSSLYTIRDSIVYFPKLDDTYTSVMTSGLDLFVPFSRVIAIPKLNWNSLVSLQGMFRNLKKLRYLPAIYVNNNISTISELCRGCSCLCYISHISRTSNIVDWRYAFDGCKSLVCAPELDFSSNIYYRGLFKNCISLIEAPKTLFESFTKNSSMYIGELFENCSALEYIPDLTTTESNLISEETTFSGCIALTKLKSSLGKVTLSSFPSNCPALKIFYTTGTYYITDDDIDILADSPNLLKFHINFLTAYANFNFPQRMLRDFSIGSLISGITSGILQINFSSRLLSIESVINILNVALQSNLVRLDLGLESVILEKISTSTEVTELLDELQDRINLISL